MAAGARREAAPRYDPGPAARIRVGEDYYLLASALATRRRKTFLARGDAFAIFDIAGDVPLAGIGEELGLFYKGTRFISRLELRLNGDFPFFLSSALSDDASQLVIQMTNADSREGGVVLIPRDSVELRRTKVLYADRYCERLRLRNYFTEPVSLVIELTIDADFADIFEIRGVERERRGRREPAIAEGATLCFPYHGLDGVRREALWTFSREPVEVREGTACFVVDLPLQGAETLEAELCCRVGNGQPPRPAGYARLVSARREEVQGWIASQASVYSSNESFNDLLKRSLTDLAVLRAPLRTGSYPYAGAPWFATVFGRDGLLTSLEMLTFAPDLGAGTLRTLAELQATQEDPEHDAQPGKILHELRHGEMAALGEIPFGRYYGSIDATPLFLLLLAEYVRRTGDLELARELWPAALAAMDWIDTYGDVDGDGYVEYTRPGASGLLNQGWKDSRDAIMHADGQLAEPPIALAEVQGYVYAVRIALADLARRLGQAGLAATWEARARALAEAFERDFWMPEKHTYALALDGEKRPCAVVASNAGHCLLAGLATAERGREVIARLMAGDMFSGWGVRTLGEGERRFNPLSYHNGSVWPHDNAIIAAGFRRYGGTAEALRILTALLDASLFVEDRRLPELFCGFTRREHEGPVPYPVACRPQAWAAGSVFFVLQAVLGLTVDGFARSVAFDSPALPRWLDWVEIRNLRVDRARLDVRVVRGRRGASVELVGREGEVDLVFRK